MDVKKAKKRNKRFFKFINMLLYMCKRVLCLKK